MKKVLLLACLLLTGISVVFSQCGGLVAGVNDGTITITGSCVINGSVILDKNNLLFNAGASLTINGDFDNDGNGDVIINNAAMIVTGNFRNDGNGTITVNGGGDLDVGGYYYNGGNGTTNFLDGTITIDGDFTNDGNGIIDAGGTVSVGGNFSNTGNGDLNVSGGLNVEGDVTISGNGDIIIENGGVLAADDISVSGGSINVEGGGTIFSETGNISGTINNDPSNSDQVCTNNCCGAQCNTSGDNLNETAQETLPVTLLYFKAEPQDHRIALYWSTATESNTSHFEVYKSMDDGSFIFLEEVAASGNSKSQNFYSATDYSPLSGVNTYQLVSVDFDGYREAFRTQYSDFTGSEVSVYPNPSDGRVLFISKPQGLESPEVTIYSLTGQAVFQGRLESHQSKIEFGTPLNQGLYIIKLREGDKTVSSRIAIR